MKEQLSNKQLELVNFNTKDFEDDVKRFCRLKFDIILSDAACDRLLNLIKNNNIKFLWKDGQYYVAHIFHKIHDVKAGCYCKEDSSIELYGHSIDISTVIHELSHYLDNKYKITSKFLCPSFNKSFNDVLLDELETNEEELMYECFSNVREKIDNEVSKGFFDKKIFPYLKQYSKIVELDRERVVLRYDNEIWEEELRLFDELYKTGFVENLCKNFVDFSPISSGLFLGLPAEKTQVLVDALSIKYDFSQFHLVGHGPDYFKDYSSHGYSSQCGKEIFAELMPGYLSNNEVDVDFKKIFPKTTRAFLEIQEHFKEYL